MTNNEYLQQQYREDMRSRNWISFNDWVAQRNPQPQRTWIGLTDEEISKLIDNEIGFNSCCGWEEEYTRAVEAKLKEKNA